MVLAGNSFTTTIWPEWTIAFIHCETETAFLKATTSASVHILTVYRTELFPYST